MITSTENTQFAPLIEGSAGNSLTMSNWQEVGVNCLCYRLSELLIKPGKALLSQLTCLKEFIAWERAIIVLIDLPKPSTAGIYSLKSSFDGRVISLDHTELLEILKVIRPDVIAIRADEKLLFELTNDLPDRTVLTYHPTDHGFIMMQADKSLWTTSVKPAEDGFKGIVYSEQGDFSVLATDMKDTHTQLSPSCQCPACRQSLTRAYFHHLLQQTPLLAQRFLIQHNVFNWILPFTNA